MARLELYGTLFVIALGSLLHFTYEAADRAWWAGIFSAMSESVWEHLKLAFWPSVLWTLLLRLGPISRPTNFWLGRAASLALTPLLIALGYYGYTALLGGHSLILDLALFALSIACGQAAAIGIYRGPPLRDLVESAAVVLILFMMLAFSTLSFIVPDVPLFEDPSEHVRRLSVLGSEASV